MQIFIEEIEMIAKNKIFAALVFSSLIPLSAQSAQVCVGQNGTFAGTSVTISCSNASQTATQILMGPSSPSSCTYTFASPISPADIKFRIFAMNAGETAEFSFNGGSTYALSSAELPAGYVLSGSAVTSSTFLSI